MTKCKTGHAILHVGLLWMLDITCHPVLPFQLEIEVIEIGYSTQCYFIYTCHLIVWKIICNINLPARNVYSTEYPRGKTKPFMYCIEKYAPELFSNNKIVVLNFCNKIHFGWKICDDYCKTLFILVYFRVNSRENRNANIKSSPIIPYVRIIEEDMSNHKTKSLVNTAIFFGAWSFPFVGQLSIRRSDWSANPRWTLFVDFKLGEMGLL